MTDYIYPDPSSPTAAPDGKAHSNTRRRWGIAAFEVFLIVLLFFAYAGWPPPSINESHYLAKAKHYWNPQWCERDFFLQSDDAHVVFFWSVGWITQYWSLTSTAWIGRISAWLLLAIGWRSMSSAVAPGPLVSVLTAAWYLMVLEHFHMSGEWVIGGVEGKAFAYAFVWMGMAAVIREQWRRSWIFFGLAIAFHAIVGVWATLAALVTCLTRAEARKAIVPMLPTMALGAILAAPSVIAGLTLDQGADADAVTRAARIMVHGRLKHHLAIHSFSIWFIVRFTALAIVWLFLSGYAARNHPPEQRMNRLVTAALAFALVGAIIDQSLLWNLDWAARLLKYYWYRLADALLPAGVALTLASAVVRKRERNPSAPGWLLVVLMVVPSIVLGTTVHGRRYDFRPLGDRRWDNVITSHEKRMQRYSNWRRVCEWIHENTPSDALLLTPRYQQTFKWYAERAEVVTWKDVPQDAENILEWQARLNDWYAAPASWRGITIWTDRHLMHLAQKYGVQYLVVERGTMLRPLGPNFQQIYPTGIEENSEFAVFQIVPSGQGFDRE